MCTFELIKTEPSPQAKALERKFRSRNRQAGFDVIRERVRSSDAHLAASAPPGVSLDWDVIEDVRCIRVTPRHVEKDREVILLHGGGYCLMSAFTHHRLAGHIAHLCRATVIVPDYPLAPEFPFPVARNKCRDIVRNRRKAGSKNLVLMGDSAGAGIALSTTYSLCSNSDPLPNAMVLLSPWVDLSLSATELAEERIDDPMLELSRLETMAAMYLNGHAPTDPNVSPLFAKTSGLPATLVQSSENDLLREDSFRLAEIWGKGLTHQHFTHMLHSFQMKAGHMPEADDALRRIARFVDETLSA